MSDPLSRRSARHRLHAEQLEDRVTPALAHSETGYLLNRVLVGVTDARAMTPIQQSPFTTSVQNLGGNSYRVDLADGISVPTAMSVFATIPGVTVAEPDYYIGTNVIPNDSSFGTLWGMNNTGQSGGTVDADIDAPEAWDIVTATGVARGTGRTVIGVIDTGVDYRHPDLYLNIWINQGEIPTAIRNALSDVYPVGAPDGVISFRDLNNPVNQGAGKITDLNGNGRIDGGDLLNDTSGWEAGGDNDGNGYVDDLIGWDFFNNDNDPMDDVDHGTHVSGTIGAIGNNSLGVTGVAWQTRIGALKFLGTNGGSTSGAIAAVNYSTATGMKVTNNSWGGGGASSLLFNAINNFRVAGGIFVAAAGNSALNNDQLPFYPSNYNVDNLIAVAAVTRTDGLSSFSNYGVANVDLGAPGSSILSTVPNNGYDTFDGTSMASPHVAGVAVVIWDAFPSLTYAQVIARILQTTRPVAALAGKTATGGMVNLQAALGVPLPPPPPGDTAGAPVVASAFSGANATSFNKVRFTFNETINAGSFTTADVISLTGPGGLVLTATGVTPVSGTQFDVTFADTATAGLYTAVIGPDILDASGNKMNQDNDLINGEVPDDRYTSFGSMIGARSEFSNTSPFAIRDLTTVNDPIVVPITQTIADLDVILNITHTWDSDLQIYLRAPNGTTITLVNRRGGSGDNFTTTVLDDEANVTIANGFAPFTGSFRPEGLLSTFDNMAANGTWYLQVYDAARGDTGYIRSVTLSFLFNNGGSSLSFTAPVEHVAQPPLPLYTPTGRVGGDFVRLGGSTERPPVVTPTPERQVDLATVPPVRLTSAQLPGITVVAGKPLWLTKLSTVEADEFAPIEV